MALFDISKWKNKLPNFTNELLVGSLILSVIGVLVYTSVRLTGNKLGANEDTYRVVAFLDDAAGLSETTAVRVAGIKVGTIEKIELEDGQAKITLLIRKSVPLYKDAILAIKSLGILGDKFILLYQGTPFLEFLSDGDKITNVQSEGNIDQVVASIDSILKDIKGVTSSLNQSLGGSTGATKLSNIVASVESLTASVDKIMADLSARSADMSANLDQTLANTADITKMLNQTLQENQVYIDSIVKNLEKVTLSLRQDLPSISGNVRGILDENRESLRNTLSQLEEASDKLKNTLQNLEKSTDEIAAGKGAVGKLINDPQLGEEVGQTIEGLNKFITESTRLKLDFGFRLERLTRSEAYKGYVSLYYIPRPDRYFLLQIVDNPRDRLETSTEEKKVTENGTTTNTTTETKTYTSDYRISLQINQRFFDSLFRLGLFENAFGFGFDQYFGFKNQYRVSLEGWDFNRINTEGPHYKFYGTWKFLGNLYLVAGLDDFANRTDQYRDNFIGIGLDFNEDSLKLISGSLPIGGLGQ